jgi:hypothetical protein
LLFLAEFVCSLGSVKESSTLYQQVHLTVKAFQLYKLFIVLKFIGIRSIGMETNLERINWCKIFFQPGICIFCLLWRHVSSCWIIEVPYVFSTIHNCILFLLQQNWRNLTFVNLYIVIQLWKWPTRCTVQVNLLFKVGCTCFRRCFRPSSGALDHIYSIW